MYFCYIFPHIYSLPTYTPLATRLFNYRVFTHCTRACFAFSFSYWNSYFNSRIHILNSNKAYYNTNWNVQHTLIHAHPYTNTHAHTLSACVCITDTGYIRANILWDVSANPLGRPCSLLRPFQGISLYSIRSPSSLCCCCCCSFLLLLLLLFLPLLLNLRTTIGLWCGTLCVLFLGGFFFFFLLFFSFL